MANKVEKVLQTVGKDALKVIEAPIKFCDKAEKVLEVAIVDQPEVKQLVTTLLTKAEAILADGVTVYGQKGTSFTSDAKAVADVEAFFEWIKDTVVVEIEKIYGQIGTAVTAPSVLPADTTK